MTQKQPEEGPAALTFSFARPADADEVIRLLTQCGLPVADIPKHINGFIVAKQDNVLVGVIGLEPCGKAALLRSLAVAASYRGQGLAKALYGRMSAYARLKGAQELYLLTTTAASYFSGLGFKKVDRKDVPAQIRATEEFRSLCPDTAVCMTKRITAQAQYYPKELLPLQPDVSGARMWGVFLDKTMLTYFEVDPDSRFETHSHESEQITLVLSGELFFEVEGGVSCVKEGEVMAIPANVSHAVFTGDKAATAVDAWSPPREIYKNRKMA